MLLAALMSIIKDEICSCHRYSSKLNVVIESSSIYILEVPVLEVYLFDEYSLKC